jgi:hypothetical protein
MRHLLVMVFVLCLVVPRIKADDVKSKSASQQYQALLDEYEDVGGTKEFAGKFLALARKYPTDPVAVDAIAWVLKKRRNHPEAAQAIGLLEKQQLRNTTLTKTFSSLPRVPSTTAEKLLRTVLEKSPHADVRAQSCYALADLLERQAGVVDQLKKEPELAGRILEYFGKDYATHLASLDRSLMDKKLEAVYVTMAKMFADVETGDETMGALAKRSLFRIRYLSVGRAAPKIKGQDIFGKEFALSDYRGKVVLLSFWGHW